jgi:hypothetical protein
LPTLLDTREAKPGTPEAEQQSRRKSFLPGRAVFWALLIFSVINVVGWNLDKDKVSSDVLSGVGSVDLTVSGFRAFPGKPGVVLLGSSLVMYPFWTMDRDSYGSIPDIFHHHDSMVLHKRLQDEGFKNASVYSLAVFGQMVSDAYIYVNEFLKDEKKPEYLVYGIAPRDFHDSDLPGPMSTNTFKRLVDLKNFSKYANLYLPAIQDKVDFVASHVCFFYAKRWRLQHEFDKAVNKFYKLFGASAPGNADTKKQENNAGFMLTGDKDERWANSMAEYSRRYKSISEDRSLAVQTGFLERLLQLCQERSIKVVVINMPLSQDNRKLLPAGFYKTFRSDIAKITARPGVKFLDMGDSNEFSAGDFWDTCHLEHGGGYKLLNHLLPNMKQLQD